MADGMRLVMESGKGLLDARALWASLVGPYRLAMAQRTSIELFSDRAIDVAKNLGVSDVYLFVSVSLPNDAAVNPLSAIFGREDTLGTNTGSPILLTNQAGIHVASFMQLLLPGEQLFGQITNLAVASQRVVVSAVMF